MNRKSHTRFRFAQKSITLDKLERLLCTPSTICVSEPLAHHTNVSEELKIEPR